MIELVDAFGPDVTIERFFEEVLPRLHETRRDDFSKMSSIPVRICVKLDGHIYTVYAGPSSIEIEADESIDFPIATVTGDAGDWEKFKKWVLRYVDVYETRKGELQDVFQFTQAFADALERYDVVVDATFVSPEDDLTMSCSVILNDFEASRDFKRFAVTISMEVADDVAAGKLTPASAARGLKISGDYAVAAELGALALRFKP